MLKIIFKIQSVAPAVKPAWQMLRFSIVFRWSGLALTSVLKIKTAILYLLLLIWLRSRLVNSHWSRTEHTLLSLVASYAIKIQLIGPLKSLAFRGVCSLWQRCAFHAWKGSITYATLMPLRQGKRQEMTLSVAWAVSLWLEKSGSDCGIEWTSLVLLLLKWEWGGGGGRADLIHTFLISSLC